MKVFTKTPAAFKMSTGIHHSFSAWLSFFFSMIMIFGSLPGQSQTSVQNFGTGTGSHTSATGSTAFIPAPTSGTTWARGGAVVPNAPINLVTAGNPLGTTGAYVRAVASSSTSVAKFSPWVAYTGSTEFYSSFKILFGDAAAGNTATSGTWSFYQGAGGMYSDANNFAGAQVFTGLQFVFGAGGAIAMTYRGGSAFINTGLTTSTLSSGTVYTFEIVGNNKTTGTIPYSYNGVGQTVAVQKFDLYLNGSKIGDDLAEALLPAGTSVASGTFIGVSSTGNVANVFVEDAIVYNAVPPTIGASAPTVTTDVTPSVISTTSATLGGSITGDGGSAITGRGVVYSETATNSTPAIGGTGVTNASTGGTTGTFTVPASPLSVNTQYSYRAYGTNAIGTSYGGVSGTTFYTLANTPAAPVVNGATANSLNVAIGSGDGNPAATEYAIHETTTPNYVQVDGSLAATPVWQTAATWGTKTVTGLTPSTLYTFEVKARNGAATETAFGPSTNGTTLNAASPVLTTSALAPFGNVCINTTAGPNTFTVTGANLTAADVTVGPLSGYSFSKDNITYLSSLTYNQAGGDFSELVYVQFTPTAVQSYNGNIPVTGGGAPNTDASASGSGVNSAPAVTTGGSSGVTQLSATLAGTIDADGCSAVTGYGIEYSLTNGFVNGTGTQAPASNLSLGTFSSNVSGLSPNTTYYYKAYATNSGGTAYGAQQSFVTLALDAPVAIAATDIAATSFTANWNAVTGANSYRLDVSTSPTFATTNATDLFISEYVEGSSNNKYIEIYNGTGAAVNLSNYKLQLYTNGSPTVSQDITLSGTLANGATMVYKNASAVAYGGTSTTSAAVNYNGDDAVALFKISTSSYVDIFGSIGFDPGTAWTGAGGYSTLDKTLVRNANVGGGLTTNPATTFPTLTTEWTLFNIDDVTHLGSHTFSVSNPSFVPGYNNLLVNGTSQSVTGLTQGTTYYYRVRAESINSTSGNSNTITVATCTLPNAGTVTGTSPLCIAATATYSSTGDTGGTWSSTVPSVATVDMNTGLVTAVSAGTTDITYTVSGCNTTASAFQTLVVNPNANAGTVSGTSPLCIGAMATYSSTGDTGGTWSSTVPSVASVDPGTGVVTALSAGSTNITYTVSTGCNPPASAFQQLVVDPNANAGTVSGTTPLCISATAQYTTTGNAGGTWSSTNPGVASVSATGVVSGVSAGTSNITYTVSGCNGPASSFQTVTVNGAAVTPGPLTGPINVCPYIGTGQQITYSVPQQSGATYTWVIPPTNVTLVSGQGTNTIIVTFQTGFASQANKQIRVTALSSCGNSPQAVFILVAQVAATPGPITASSNNICAVIGTAGTITYTIRKVESASSYIWTAQAGTTIITHPNGTGPNDTTVNVSFTNGFTTSAITVQAANSCGTSGARSLTITRSNPAVGPITGPTNACPYILPNGTAATYSVTPVATATSYNWTTPAGSVVTHPNGTGANDYTITVQFPAGFTSGSITVSVTNGCGTSAVRTLAISRLLPSAPGPIDVMQTAPCPNRVYTYTIPAMPANATSIQWTVPSGATIISGQGTTSITVSYPPTGINGNVTAQAVNNCGSSSVRSLAVQLPACPPGPRSAEFSKAMVPITAENISVNIFPNPSVSDFKLQIITRAKEAIQVRIADMQGRELKQFIVMPYQTINIGSELKAGTYTVEVRQGKEMKTTRILKF